MDNSTVDLSNYFASVFGSDYVTAQFDPTDPRNVAPGNNSVNVNDKPPSEFEQLLKKHKTAILWAAAGLVGLAVLKGRR